MNVITEQETGGIRMSPLFEVSFISSDGKTKISELLPASGFEDARDKAEQIANKRGTIVIGIVWSPWRVIMEFVTFE